MENLKITKVKVRREDGVIDQYNLKIDLEDSLVAQDGDVTIELASNEQIHALFEKSVTNQINTLE